MIEKKISGLLRFLNSEFDKNRISFFELFIAHKLIKSFLKENKKIYVASKKKGIYDLPFFDEKSLSSKDIENEIERGFES